MEKNKSSQIDQYIRLVYDQRSELNKIHNLEERKVAACVKVKLDINLEKVKDLMHMRDKDANVMIFEYLKNNNSNEFILLLSDQHLFWEIQQRQIEPLLKSEDADSVMKDLDLKTKMSEKSKDLLDRIKERYTMIFIGEKEQEMAVEKMRIMRPESRLKNQKKQA